VADAEIHEETVNPTYTENKERKARDSDQVSWEPLISAWNSAPGP
jgi:hypothetical protein